MREVAESLRDVGIHPLMAEATAERQDWLVDAMMEENLKYKEHHAVFLDRAGRNAERSFVREEKISDVLLRKTRSVCGGAGVAARNRSAPSSSGSSGT